jgi:hypothetical protein
MSSNDPLRDEEPEPEALRAGLLALPHPQRFKDDW